MDISKFTDVQLFRNNLQDMADRIRLLPRSGEEPVMVAGDPEKKSFATRSVTGIPVGRMVWNEFIEINKEFKNAVL